MPGSSCARRSRACRGRSSLRAVLRRRLSEVLAKTEGREGKVDRQALEQAGRQARASRGASSEADPKALAQVFFLRPISSPGASPAE